MNIIWRNLRWLLMAAIGAAAVETSSFGSEPAQANAPSITTGPILQGPTETSIAVAWITDRNTTAVVEYGAVGGALKTAFASRDGLIEANQRLHKVVLPDLEPGMPCRYRVVSRDIVSLRSGKVDCGESVASELRQFRMFDRRKSQFSFLVFNDIHDQAATIPEMLKVAGEQAYDVVLLNGDTLDNVGNEGQITSILNQAATSFASGVPLIWVRGNHETRGAFARQLFAYIAWPNGHYYYSFDHGPVHFIVLDTGEDKADDHREYGGLADFSRYRREQGEWLKAEVKTVAFRQAKYRVVFCHMPFPDKKSDGSVEPNNTFTGMDDAFGQFGATLDQAGVDLMISGHTHRPEIVQPEPGRHKYPIVVGGGSGKTDRTLIRVNVKDTGLEAVILRSDGTVFGTCQIPGKPPIQK